MKTFVPWLCVLLLAAGLAYVYSDGKSKSAELTKLQGEARELERLRTENSELKKVEAQVAEVEQLRKDNEDLPRLRNEVRQLREEKKQLSQEAQSAQSAAQRAQAQAQAAQSQAQAAQSQAQALVAQAQALRTNTPQALPPELAARYGQPLTPEQQVNACINILRQMDGAKQQWALENRQAATAVPTAQDITPYFRRGVVPACPAGGTHSINAVGATPTCSSPGHAL